MPDDPHVRPNDARRLDPPIAVPEPAPLDMPRRRLRPLPFALPRALPQPASTETLTDGTVPVLLKRRSRTA